MEGDQYCIMTFLASNYGEPLRTDGKRYSERDEYDEDDKDYTVFGYEDKMLSSVVEMLHYDDLKEYNNCLLRDLKKKTNFNIINFKKSHKRHEEPQHLKELYKYIVKGQIYFAYSITKYFFVIYIGFNLSKPFKKSVKKCLKKKKCTFSVTKKCRTYQRAFRCKTCFPNDDSLVICESCMLKCHIDHDILVKVNQNGIFEKSFMFCDCGDLLNCKCQ